jgi:hypothetical protein
VKRKPVNEAAQALAKQLLEGTVCAWCAPGGPPGTSHGVCRRHFIETMREAGVPEETIKTKVARKDKEGNWSPDLGTDTPAMEHIAYLGGDYDTGPEPAFSGGKEPDPEPEEKVRHMKLSEILSDEDLSMIEKLWNSSSNPEEGMNRLRGFLMTRREELEAKGVDPGYLAYYLYAIFTKAI